MRVEIESKSGSDSYRIMPFGKHGVLLYYLSNERTATQNKQWFFTLYDVNFRELWHRVIEISDNMKLKAVDKNDSTLFLLFAKSYDKKNSKSDFQVLKMNIGSGTSKIVPGVNPDNSYITDFRVVGNNAWLSGRTTPKRSQVFAQTLLSITLIPVIAGVNVIKYHASLYALDLETGALNNASPVIDGQAYVSQLRTDSTGNVLYAVVKNHIPKRENYMYLCSYTGNGNSVGQIRIQSNDVKRKFNSANIIPLGNNKLLVIGTYNNFTKGYSANPASSGFSESSTGIYITRLTDGKQDFVKFYNFSTFKNFYNFLNAKSALRMKKKAIRQAAKGKEMSIDYSLLVHDIIQRGDKSIMIAEAYYPEYHTVSYTTYDAYGRPQTTSYSVFDGYRYTHAIIVCFDTEGKLLWDNSFEIGNILTYNLKRRVETLFDGEDIVMMYSNAGEIASKVIHGNTVVEGKDYTKIETNYSGDQLVSDYNSDMEFWYGNYFISYGYQKIRNSDAKAKSKRTVFYFNKIAFN
jgi:hypothetical protein